MNTLDTQGQLKAQQSHSIKLNVVLTAQDTGKAGQRVAASVTKEAEHHQDTVTSHTGKFDASTEHTILRRHKRKSDTWEGWVSRTNMRGMGEQERQQRDTHKGGTEVAGQSSQHCPATTSVL
ncbi:hypothetical protein E2C01_008477 [Portunus trituberculatus]|uniref:Uncharacterized protein n=1 Tax=Portunus trituberculatus TaxID=210409 RepID=A0A5B7D2H0_PORTR|nr:hypothetical protein [Portunus trituberculatus]